MCHEPHWLNERLGYKNTVKGVLMVRRQPLYGNGMFCFNGKKAISRLPEIPDCLLA